MASKGRETRPFSWHLEIRKTFRAPYAQPLCITYWSNKMRKNAIYIFLFLLYSCKNNVELPNTYLEIVTSNLFDGATLPIYSEIYFTLNDSIPIENFDSDSYQIIGDIIHLIGSKYVRIDKPPLKRGGFHCFAGKFTIL